MIFKTKFLQLSMLVMLVMFSLEVTFAQVSGNQDAYNQKINEAEKLFFEKKYPEAKTAFQAASTLKPDESHPRSRIHEINTILGLEASPDQKYNAAIKKGDAFYQSGKLKEALESYKEANDALPGQAYATDKILEIYDKIKIAEANDKTYAATITQADQLFGNKKYDEARTQYEKALAMKPSESYPSGKIAEINKISLTNNEYQKAIEKADELYVNQDFENARAAYVAAASIKPSETYCQNMISRIDEQIAKKEGQLLARQQAYDEAIAKADKLFTEKNYLSAKASYEEGLRVKPTESYPQAKITEITNLMANIEATEQQYQKAIEDGNLFFGSKNFESSLAEFKKAKALKPAEKYPSEKITEIEGILAGMKNDQAYQDFLTKANQSYEAKKYEKAKSEYQNALSVKPEEVFPKARIEEINGLLAGIAEKNQAYQTSIAKADQLFAEAKYELAKAEFQTASNLKPEESYPKEKIAEITTLLSGIVEKNQAYQTSITKADQLFNEAKYDLAKAEYQTASALKPEEVYPKDKIAEISTLLAGIAEKNQAYQTSITKADQLFSEAKYDLAKAEYHTASALKPEEVYPKDKIAEISTLLAGIAEKNQAYQTSITKADQLFAEAKYDLAKTEYQTASTLKPEEKYPKDKITEITTLLAGITEKNQAYQSSITKADQLFAEAKYDLAKTEYQTASTLKPEETYPKDKIAEITTLLAGIAEKNQAYQTSITKADQLFSEAKYDLAKAEYQTASTLKPEEAYPKNKIAEITTLLAGIAEKNQAYQTSITKADQLFSEAKYDLAKTEYQTASDLKPEETYPKTRIAEITTLLAGIAEKNQAYQTSITKADQLFSEAKYDLAKAEYQTASTLKPEETYPKDKIAEITTLLAGIAEKNQAYQTSITKADQLFNEAKYDLAKAEYQSASTLKPEETYPKDKIAEITSLLAGVVEKNQEYQTSITKADQLFAEAKYELAKTEYQTASTLKPEEAYPKNKITEITTLLAGIAEKNQAYQTSITKADQLFSEAKYDQAKNEYQTASTLKPEESYPKEKIAEITTLLAGIAEKNQAYQTSVTKADQLFAEAKYDLAKTEYQTATTLKPEEAYPKSKIAEITTLLAGIAEKNQAYQTSISKADQLFSEAKYDLAKTEYQTASTLKPEEAYPKNKIAEITTLLAGIAEKNQAYQTSITKADQLFAEAKYDLAKTEYQTASNLKSEEKYPKDKIAEITTLLAGITEKNQAYQTSITKADQLFAEAKYDLAKTEYQTASNLKPEESYPKEKIAEISTLLAGIAEKNQAYQTSITKADQLFSEAKYDLAKTEYQTASNLKPEEKYPKDKIAEITTLLAGITEKNQAYQTSITKADQLFSEAKYDLAKAEYQTASTLKPEEKYPKDKIAEISTLLAGIAEKNQAFQTSITKADQLFAEAKYDLAKTEYQTASTLKPEEAYPKNKIAEISTLLAGIAEKNQAYQNSITKADQLFAEAKYDLAKAEYQTASNLKPEEGYPKEKIAEISTLLAGIAEKNQAYQTSITKADQLFSEAKYDLAKAEYQIASTMKPEEAYPKSKIAEIENIIVDQSRILAEKKKNYDNFISTGDFHFAAQNYHKAKDAYAEATKIFPEESYPIEKRKEIEAILMAELERIQKDYNKAIKEADAFFLTKTYDNAIESYSLAAEIKPDETYPAERIAMITKIMEENVVVDLIKNSREVANNELASFDFEPVRYQGRKESYIILKAKNTGDSEFRLFLSYGKSGAKNGGFVVNIPKSDNLRDYIIKVGSQYKWFSEDNNWISLQPEGGSLEVTLFQISQE